jgi:hypothetical protein
MKKMYYLSTLAIVVSMLISCQEEITDASQPSKSIKHSSARIASDCACVDSFDPTDKVTFTAGSPEITVTVWNNATTVYYYLHRTDNGQIGNLFVDTKSQGGSNLNFYNFTKPVGLLNACDEQTTTCKVVGANGPPVEFVINYKIVALCNLPPSCIAYTYDSGMGGPTAGSTASTNKAWWYYYPAGSNTQTIWAGKTKPAGTVMIDGSGNFSIVLAAGWELKTGDQEPIKIQGYDTAPSSRPAAGLFSGASSYKGSSLFGAISPKPIYVVHLDLQKCSAYSD